MPDGVIEMVCNGDLPVPFRDSLRKFIKISDLQYLAEQREKATVDAATFLKVVNE